MDLRMAFGRALVGLLALATGSCLLAQTIPAATAPGIPLSTAPAMPVAAAPETAPAPAPRVPVPTGAAIQDALKLIREVYEQDLAAARKPVEKDALATKLLQAGMEEKDPSARYVVLTMARDMASEVGDLALAMSAATELVRGFELDSFKARTDTTLAASRNVSTDPLRRRFVETAHALLDEVLAADRYDLARQISDVTVSVARAGNDSVTTKTVAADAQHVRDLDLAFRDLEKPLAALSANPADPDANLKVGRFRCFIRGDWAAGLPLLAQAGDKALQTLAAKELALTDSVEARVEVADGWAALVDKAIGPAKQQLQTHAEKYYREALPALTGLQKARVQKRLTQWEAANPPPDQELLDTLVGTSTSKKDGCLVLTDFQRVRTPDSYRPPVLCRVTVQTNSTNVRLGYAADQIIFNWEGDRAQLRIDGGPANGQHRRGAGAIPVNQWVQIDLEVRPDLMIIRVDGQERQRVKADFSQVNDPLSIFPANGSTIQVKSVLVRKL